jgi:uncharacterized iron-regulated membrane protein
MKIFFRRIHLYLSLAAGLVILIACLTGAILVFEKDLQMVLSKKRHYVETAGNKLSLDQLVNAVKGSFPEARVNGIKVYEDATRSAEVNVTFPPREGAKAEEPKAKAEKKGPPQRQPGFTIFVNP